MLVRYIGPHDEVTVDIFPPATCKRGGTVDVAAEVAESLVAQDTWELAPAKRAPAADTPKES
jgi:hypothetical protein